MFIFVFLIGRLKPNSKHTISLRFLGIIWRVLRLEVSRYNDYIAKQFQTNFFSRGGREQNLFSRGGCEQLGEKVLRLLSQLRSRIRPRLS
jgi:hypothetical protein